MKSRTACLFRFLLPPLYAATILAVGTTLFDSGRVAAFPALLGIFVLYAYVFAGLPALIFAVLMNRFAQRCPEVRARLVRAMLLGLIAGIIIAPVFALAGFFVFPPLGLVVGFAVEATLVRFDHKSTPTHTT